MQIHMRHSVGTSRSGLLGNHDLPRSSKSVSGHRKQGRFRQFLRQNTVTSLVFAVFVCNILAFGLFYRSRHPQLATQFQSDSNPSQAEAHRSNAHASGSLLGLHLHKHDSQYAERDEDVTTHSTTHGPLTSSEDTATQAASLSQARKATQHAQHHKLTKDVNAQDKKQIERDLQEVQEAVHADAGEKPAASNQVVHRLHSATNRWREHLNKLAERARSLSKPVGPPKILPDPEIAKNQTDWPIWWMAPFFDRTSFGKEAAKLVLGMIRSGAVPEKDIWIGTTQGECSYGVDTSMTSDDFRQLDAANHRWNMSYSAIVVCHSLPPFWARPKNKWQTCFPCPPVGYTPAVTIGRAMAETDIYHSEFVKYCNRMDEVWVPSDFSKRTLHRSGVPADKIRVVPIAVNTTWFDPDRVDAIRLPAGDLVFGRHRRAGAPSTSSNLTAAGDLVLEQRKPTAADDKEKHADKWKYMLAGDGDGISGQGEWRSRKTGRFLRQIFRSESDEDEVGHKDAHHTRSLLSDIFDTGREFDDGDNSDFASRLQRISHHKTSTQKQRSQSSDSQHESGGAVNHMSDGDGNSNAVSSAKHIMHSTNAAGVHAALHDQALTSGVDAGGVDGVDGFVHDRATTNDAGSSRDGSSEAGDTLQDQHDGDLASRLRHLTENMADDEKKEFLRDLNLGSDGRRQLKAQGTGAHAFDAATFLDVKGRFTGSHAEAPNMKFLPSNERHKQRSATDPVVLISCFKWEMRKGWDTLLSAYLQEFTHEDHVELYILTKPFMSSSGDFKGEMRKWVAENLRQISKDQDKLPSLYVISHHITDMEYVGLLKAADAYVSATRGEGWGMPISEAMAMGLPVVVTNWSGVVDFVDESVGYMVDYNLTQVPNDQPWWFRGARWATASVASMRQRLREVVSDRHQALRKGMRARELMVRKYSPEALAFTLAKEFQRLKDMLRSGDCQGKCHNQTWVAPPGDTALDLYTGEEEFLHRGEAKMETDGEVIEVLSVESEADQDVHGHAGSGIMVDDVT